MSLVLSQLQWADRGDTKQKWWDAMEEVGPEWLAGQDETIGVMSTEKLTEDFKMEGGGEKVSQEKAKSFRTALRISQICFKSLEDFQQNGR